MLEQKQDRNKQRIEKRIFKWIGLTLLVLLLITGLIFQAPLKVITLLVIILAACTVLPKPARKWFWIPAGTYSRRKCAKLGVIFVGLYVPSAPEKIGEMVDASYEELFVKQVINRESLNYE